MYDVGRIPVGVVWFDEVATLTLGTHITTQ